MLYTLDSLFLFTALHSLLYLPVTGKKQLASATEHDKVMALLLLSVQIAQFFDFIQIN